MAKPLTVGELRAMLLNHDQNAKVYVDREGELRALTEEDFRVDTYTADAELDADGDILSGPVVVFTSWS
jgi:hypothetical protein